MPTSNIELLLIEDSDADAELTLRALRRRHVANSLHRVQDGVEALDFLFARGDYADRDAANLPKVVLLDLKLPKLSGLAVLSALREDGRTRDVPVVVLTSSREDPDVARAYALGVNSYIVKPVDFSKFADAVAELGLYWLLLNQRPN